VVVREKGSGGVRRSGQGEKGGEEKCWGKAKGEMKEV